MTPLVYTGNGPCRKKLLLSLSLTIMFSMLMQALYNILKSTEFAEIRRFCACSNIGAQRLRFPRKRSRYRNRLMKSRYNWRAEKMDALASMSGEVE